MEIENYFCNSNISALWNVVHVFILCLPSSAASEREWVIYLIYSSLLRGVLWTFLCVALISSTARCSRMQSQCQLMSVRSSLCLFCALLIIIYQNAETGDAMCIVSLSG
jgi:hypothetical protein